MINPDPRKPSIKEISDKMKKQSRINELEQLIKLDLNTLSAQIGNHERGVVIATASRLRNELDQYINFRS